MINLELSADVYSENSIKQTIAVYKNYAVIKLKKKRNKWILKFSKCRYDEQLTVKEFENYLIGTENS